MNIADNLEKSAYYFPNNIAVFEEDRKVTFTEFNREASRIASALVNTGVQPGDHVALCAPNSYAWLAFYFGVLKAGAVAVTFSHLLTREELYQIISDCRPRVLFTTDAKRNDLKGIKQSNYLERIVSENGDISYDRLIATGSSDFQTLDRDRQYTAAILYTGGTTGIPKGAMLSH